MTQGYAPLVEGSEEEKVYDVPVDIVLTAGQSLTASMDADQSAEFAWRGLVVSQATGAFAVKFTDSRQYSLSPTRIASGNLSSDASNPYPIFPEVVVPPLGKVTIDILDTSGAGNTIQLVFRGVRRARRR